MQATLMFADIVGFTTICKQVTPDVVMTFLNDLYREFDDLVPIFNVYWYTRFVKCVDGNLYKLQAAVSCCEGQCVVLWHI